MLVQSKYNDFGLKNSVIKVYDVLTHLYIIECLKFYV